MNADLEMRSKITWTGQSASLNLNPLILNMTIPKSQKRETLSRKSGVFCSCCMILLGFSMGVVYAFPNDSAPSWFGIACFTAIFGGIVSAAICLTMAVSAVALKKEERKETTTSSEPCNIQREV